MNRTPLGKVIALWGVAILVGLIVLVGLFAGVKSFGRYQKRADAGNNVQVTAINIRNAQQQAKVVHAQNATIKAKADQRKIEAIGLRNAQVEVAKTLTPLYVQFEAVQAQLAMAHSTNHTIIYVPSTTNGTPVITQSGNAK